MLNGFHFNQKDLHIAKMRWQGNNHLSKYSTCYRFKSYSKNCMKCLSLVRFETSIFCCYWVDKQCVKVPTPKAATRPRILFHAFSLILGWVSKKWTSCATVVTLACSTLLVIQKVFEVRKAFIARIAEIGHKIKSIYSLYDAEWSEPRLFMSPIHFIPRIYSPLLQNLGMFSKVKAEMALRKIAFKFSMHPLPLLLSFHHLNRLIVTRKLWWPSEYGSVEWSHDDLRTRKDKLITKLFDENCFSKKEGLRTGDILFPKHN